MKVSENQMLHLSHERRIMGSWMSRTLAGKSAQTRTSKPL